MDKYKKKIITANKNETNIAIRFETKKEQGSRQLFFSS